MYESTINRICGEINDEIIRKDEEHLMTIITQQVGYQVDNEELIKALQYDRNQYKKGFADALDKIREEIMGLDVDYDSEGFYKCQSKVLGIIDKYKESEVKNER